jgi:hypothetical protein
MAAFEFHRRQTRRWWYAGVTLVAAAVFSVFYVGGAAAKPTPPQPAGPYAVPTGPIGVASAFADNQGSTSGTFSASDYNISGVTQDPNAPATQPTFDWNSLPGASNPTYSGTSPDPYGQASGTTGGWKWVALADAKASTTDTGFAGGTKEDKNCAAVIGSKAPNKDDMKRVYLAAKTLANGHIILNLAWVRIPQNTTSPSAHLAFEFNQGSTACGAGSDGLVRRQAGDLLVLYDFTGGGVAPSITIDRWVTSGACDVGSDSSTDSNGGCWGPGTTLDGTEAEANVDTGISHICSGTTGCGPGESDHNTSNSAGTQYVLPYKTTDHLAPTTDDSLGTMEFGEAGVDLTNAGVFTSASCTSFGQADAVSRTSGDSGTAAMEDLVGPGTFTLSNCSTSTATAMKKSSDNNTFTSLSNNGSITSGTYVKDSATVTVSGVSTWSGSVAFYLCKSSDALTSCDKDNPGTGVTVTQVTGANSPYTVSNLGTTVTSDSTQVTAAGNYCWEAIFTHSTPSDLPNGNPSKTGECFSVTTPTSIATNPWFYPQDRAVISASSGGDLAGSVSFKLFDSSADCTANGATGLLYSEGPDSVSGASPQTVDTSNTDYLVSSSTSASLYWRVTYSSTNTNQTGSSSVCVENIGATITADGSVTFP